MQPVPPLHKNHWQFPHFQLPQVRLPVLFGGGGKGVMADAATAAVGTAPAKLAVDFTGHWQKVRMRVVQVESAWGWIFRGSDRVAARGCCGGERCRARMCTRRNTGKSMAHCHTDAHHPNESRTATRARL